MLLLLYGNIVFKRLLRYIQIRPHLDFWYIKFIYERSSPLSEMKIASDRLHRLVSRLTLLSYPLEKTEFDTWWIFYLPLKRRRWEVFPEAIAIPVRILRYRNRYFLLMQSIGCIEIAERKDPEVARKEKIGISYIHSGELINITERVIREMYRFSAFIMTNLGILEDIVPYDVRTGKIKGKYVLEDVISKQFADSVPKKIS